MKYALYPLIILFFISSSSRSQGLYQSLPTAQTKDVLQELIKNDKVIEGKEIIYAFHLYPNSCPRCEGLINPLIEALKRQNGNSKNTAFIMIYDYFNVEVPEKYQNLKKFDIESIIVDSKSRLMKSMQITSDFLYVPYLYKIDKASGNILYSSSLLGMNINENLIEKIASSKIKVPVVSSILKPLKETNLKEKIPDHNLVVKLKTQNDTLSFPKACFFSPLRNSFIWLDDMFSEIYEIDKNGNVITELSPLSQEFSYNVDPRIEPNLFNYLKDNNILNVIYLDILNLNESKVNLVASLPKVTFEANNTDTTIDYFNEICIVEKDLNDTGVKINAIDLPDSLVDLGFFTKHYLLKPIGQNSYLLPLFKGWPVKGTEIFDPTNTSPAYNPFVESFYFDKPLFLLYDALSAKHIALGSLPTEAKKYEWGYYFFKPVVDTIDSIIVYNNGMDDKLEMYSMKLKKSVGSIKLNFPNLISVCKDKKKSIMPDPNNNTPYGKIEALNYNFIRDLIITSDSVVYYILQNKYTYEFSAHKLDLKGNSPNSKTILKNIASRKDYFHLQKNGNEVLLIQYNNNPKNSNIYVKTLE